MKTIRVLTLFPVISRLKFDDGLAGRSDAWMCAMRRRLKSDFLEVVFQQK